VPAVTRRLRDWLLPHPIALRDCVMHHLEGMDRLTRLILTRYTVVTNPVALGEDNSTIVLEF